MQSMREGYKLSNMNMGYKKGKLALKILFMLSVGILIPASFVVPNLPKAMEPLLKELLKKLDAKPQSFRNSLAYLKRNRLVTVKEKGNKMTYVLSEKGKRRMVEGEIDEIEITQPKKWDNKWRVILFDIPEKQRIARDALRRKLHQIGFLQIQKSCFVHPFECRDEIDFITEFFNISPYVRYLQADYIEGADELIDHFNLG